MKCLKSYFPLFSALVLLIAVSCSSTPKTPPDPAPDQEALNALDAARTRAENGRKQALDVQGPTYFPNDWGRAETDNEAGKRAGKETVSKVTEAIARFTAAATGYEYIAEQSAPLFAQDMEDSAAALEAAIARAAESRKDALNNQGPTYFPEDWEAAEGRYQKSEEASRDTLPELKNAVVYYTEAADAYDDIAERSRPLFAKDTEEAQTELDAAIARAEKSRQAAMDVDGPTYFPNDWKTAETQNQSAKNAGKATADEIKAAAALFSTAADTYDDIAQKSGAKFAKDKDDAQKALDAAIARMNKSRQAATDIKAQTAFPNEWKTAETKNQTATSAKRGTATEIKAATPLYASAADAYDDIVKKNASQAANDQKAMADAKAKADKERQAAVTAKAETAAADDFKKADTIYQQAVKDFNAKSAAATNGFNQAAPLFTASAQAAEKKRAQAADTIAKTKTKSADSVSLAANAGRTTEGTNE